MLRDERGAEALEFAIVFPVAALIIFGLIYGLLALSAHISLAHAAARGVRYASLPTDPVAGIYPTVADVEQRVDESTPFFTGAACETTVVGEAKENAPVTLDVSCDFPNPIGATLSALRSLFGGSGDAYSDDLTISAHSESRRE
jgi:Flp pilus assembly protein TadG